MINKLRQRPGTIRKGYTTEMTVTSNDINIDFILDDRAGELAGDVYKRQVLITGYDDRVNIEDIHVTNSRFNNVEKKGNLITGAKDVVCLLYTSRCV